jgi:hypothetical protein
MSDVPEKPEGDCVLPPANSIPPSELHRYSPERDAHSEQDIADYVYGQARDETVQHVEKVKEEFVLGQKYEIWDVTTDKDRWWVLTNLTNLYSQRHFPSLDYTLSFHIGLMARIRSRSGPDDAKPDPFDEVFRRQEQSKERFERAIESEDYQAVGMQLRECLLSLITALRRRTNITPSDPPPDANFNEWVSILMDALSPGPPNEQLRRHMKNGAKDTWQLVNWLTHDRNATNSAASIAIAATDTVVGHSITILLRERTDPTHLCPTCKSRDIRTHFDIDIGQDGDYFLSCGSCGWTDHPPEA